MGTTVKQDNDFISSVISSSLLEESIEWIGRNMEPNDVFDDKTLEHWAINNGFKWE
jgi:hypothetical protein